MDDKYYGNICYCRKCNGVVHTIKKGDTLYLISKYYKVPIGEIMGANKNLNIYNLQIGDEICIPMRRPEPIEPRQSDMTDNIFDMNVMAEEERQQNMFSGDIDDNFIQNTMETESNQNANTDYSSDGMKNDVIGENEYKEQDMMDKMADAVSDVVSDATTNIGNMTLNEFAKLLLKM